MSATPDRLGTPESRRRKMFVLARGLELTHEERLELASVILWRDILSWRDLDDDQVLRLLDALEGAEKVLQLYRMRL
jgi:hypothetical protein